MNRESIHGNRLWHKSRVLWLVAAIVAIAASQVVLSPHTGLSTLASLVCLLAAGLCLTLASVARDPHTVKIDFFKYHLAVTQQDGSIDIPWEDVQKVRYMRSLSIFQVFVNAKPEVPLFSIDSKALSSDQVRDLKRSFRAAANEYHFGTVHMDNL